MDIEGDLLSDQNYVATNSLRQGHSVTKIKIKSLSTDLFVFQYLKGTSKGQ